MKQSSYNQMNSYNTSNTRRERRDSALSSGSRCSTNNLSVSRKPSAKESKPETKTEAKPSSQVSLLILCGIYVYCNTFRNFLPFSFYLGNITIIITHN